MMDDALMDMVLNRLFFLLLLLFELTNEKAGIIANPEDLLKSEGEIWSVGHTLSASIGQGRHSFTPIQMAKYISTLVNGGERINPTIIKNITTSSGEEISKAEIQGHTRQILGDTKDDSSSFIPKYCAITSLAAYAAYFPVPPPSIITAIAISGSS